MNLSLELKTYGEVSDFLNKKSIPASMLNDMFRATALHGVSMLDATSKGQLASKIWLSDTIGHLLHQRFKNVLICGGWYGTLIPIFNHYNRSEEYTSIDLDPECELVLNMVVSSVRENTVVTAKTVDMYVYDYIPHDLIINTSTEHIPSIVDWLSLIPRGKTVLLQNNNMYGYDGHVNCKSTLEEFSLEVKDHMNIVYSGKLVLPDYTRFMICGMKK